MKGTKQPVNECSEISFFFIAALIISAQLLISPLTGGWRLVLATPLMLIIMILVQELYLKHTTSHNE
jgi:hypothetical protein